MKLAPSHANCPSRTKPIKGHRCASQQNWLANDRLGSFASGAVRTGRGSMSAVPPKADVIQRGQLDTLRPLRGAITTHRERE
jgi:hypothetical protein